MFTPNQRLLDQLLQDGTVLMRRSSLLDQPPPPLASHFTWDKAEGMLLGLAIGDSLGNTTESQMPDKRYASHGEITDYLPNLYADNKKVGLPSDDSQMAFWTLEALLADGSLNPEHLLEVFSSRRIFGIGGAVQEAIGNYKQEVRPWYLCPSKSAGNGALMRIAPVLLPYLQHPSEAIWADAALAALTTHNDAASLSACCAWVYLLWSLLGMEQPPSPQWWVDTYVKIAREFEGEATYNAKGVYSSYLGPLWHFVEEKLPKALKRNLTIRQACDEWYSGAFLLETVPSVLYILMKYAHDPEQALIRAVNDTVDNDTIAAVVGSAVGALHGAQALPLRWRQNLSGRTGAIDDGHIEKLITQAHATYWH